MPKINNSNLSNEKQKELKMKLGQLQEEIPKASLSVNADLSNNFESIIFETNQRKNSPFMRCFGRSNKNIYNLPKIMLHITLGTLLLMLHIRQLIYLVLTFAIFYKERECCLQILPKKHTFVH